MVLSPELIVMLVAALGPLLVAAITGLETKSWVKALLAVLTSGAIAAGQQLLTGGFSGGDYVQMFFQVAAVWQSMYMMLWKNTPIAAWLQAHIPIQINVVDGKLVIAPRA